MTGRDRPAAMRQAVIVAADRFEVRQAPVPQLQDDGEILVATVACGLCSGDLMPWYLTKKIGTVLGHEVVARVVEVGAAVRHVKPGDLVFLHHHAPCGACPECRRGAFVHCPVWRASRLDPGGMAEFIRVPADIVRGDTFAVGDLAVSQAVFIEPLGCCLKALGRLLRVAGASGVVVGCGVMGLLHLLAARALGAGPLFAVEPDAQRRRRAVTCGAEVALTPQEACDTLRHRGDFVIVGPGHPDVIRQALGYVRPGGTALLFTPTPTGVTTALDLGELYFREVSLVPSYSCGPHDTRRAYEMLRSGQMPAEDLITHHFPLENVQQAYDTARSGGAALKVIVTFADA